MIALFFDTCTHYLNVGIVKDSELLYEYKKNSEKEHSKIALEEIKKALEETNIKPNEINKIIVTTGPGSYTGIRIGVTIAKTYAWDKKIDIIPASSLMCLALSGFEINNHLSLIDARRESYFAAFYDKDYKEIMEEKYIPKEALEEILKNKIYEISNEDTPLNILKVVEFYKDKTPINPHELNPKYLKQTEAEENLI